MILLFVIHRQERGPKRSIIVAGINTHAAGGLAAVVELALRLHVGRIERVGVGLILKCAAVAKHDHKAARAQRLRQRLVIGRCRDWGRKWKHDREAASES